MSTKQQIIIDGVAYYKQQDINKGLDEEHYITEFHLLATHYNLLLEDYARKTQECEEKQKIIDELVSECKRISSNYKKDEDHYRKALEEIEDFRKKHCDFWCERNKILDIINKAKGTDDE